MKLQAVPDSKFAVDSKKIPRMHQIRLDISLDPARTLPDPEWQTGAGLFPGRRFQNPGTPAGYEQAQPQVAIFGDIVLIPAAKLTQYRQLEMIRGTAQRNRRLQAIQPGQAQTEPGRILRRKTARQKIPVGIVIAQLGLDAGHFLRRFPEGPGRLFQLVGLRFVLSIINHQIIRFSIFNADVASLRFGTRCGFGNQDHDKGRLQLQLVGGRTGLFIILLNQKTDFQTILRVVQLFQTPNQFRQHFSFVIHWQDHHIPRPLLAIGRTQKLFRTVLDFRWPSQSQFDDKDAVQGSCQVKYGQRNVHHQQFLAPVKNGP